LAMLREKMLAEIAIADQTEVSIKPPKAPSQERKGIDKTKYADSTNATATPPMNASI
jgi:hypothetical protein